VPPTKDHAFGSTATNFALKEVSEVYNVRRAPATHREAERYHAVEDLGDQEVRGLDALHRYDLMVNPYSLHHIGVPQYTGYSLIPFV
jgi:hypothetical protein